MKEEPRQVFLTQAQWDNLPESELDIKSVYNIVEHDEDGEITRTVARYVWDDTIDEFIVEE